VSSGYLYMALAVVSFSLTGIFAKVADTRNCRPTAIYTLLYAWSLALVSVFGVLGRGASFGVPATVAWIALPFGIAAVIGGLAFQTAIRYGKLSSSWLIISLSAAVPTVCSIIVYREPVGLRQVAVLALVVASVLLLWKDRADEERRAREKEAGACGTA
jgi:drug/metabolite transporter (DMT)-like permease